MTTSRTRSGHRRPRRWAAATLVLAGLLVVPRAAAAPTDPYDPAAPGSVDPFGDPAQGPLCDGVPIAPIPAGFVPPDGLPAKTGCTIVRTASGVTGTPTRTNYTGVATLGVQGAPHLGQWVRIPPAISVAVVPIHLNQLVSSLDGDPPGTKTAYTFYPQVWFVSQDRKRVGEMPPFTVSSLAFGSIPVTVTVTITQPKNADGTVEPVRVAQKNPQNFTPNGTNSQGEPYFQLVRNAHGGGRVDVRLSDATVDGVPLDLGGRCHTSRLASLTLQGDGYLASAQDQSRPVPTGKYNGARGGTLHGTLDIPPFTGCVSRSGDDVSPLLTNLVSGNGNPITLNQTAANKVCYPQYDMAACQAGLANLGLPTTLPQPVPAP